MQGDPYDPAVAADLLRAKPRVGANMQPALKTTAEMFPLGDSFTSYDQLVDLLRNHQRKQKNMVKVGEIK